MSYTFSFNVAPPIGFSINDATGLITIAADAIPFTGTLLVRVSDGVSIDVKSIQIALTAPVITPLLSSITSSVLRAKGRVTETVLKLQPIAFRSTAKITAKISNIAVTTSTCRANIRVMGSSSYYSSGGS